MDLHGGLPSEPCSCLKVTAPTLSQPDLFFFLPCCPGNITFEGSVSTKVLFVHSIIPPRYPVHVFLLLFLCPHELRSLELTLISKVVVQLSAESKFFFQALNICQQTLWRSDCCPNKLCGKTQWCCSPLPTIFLRFDKTRPALHLRPMKWVNRNLC